MNFAVFRILDANLNRAREAMRVMEEYARFALEDATLSAALKDLRHQLVASVPRDWVSGLNAHRDTPRDIGTTMEAAGEYRRADAADVALASCKRLAEALRVLEEYSKTLDAQFAAQIERMRYRAYELERRLIITGAARDRFGSARLYVILTEALCRDDWWSTAGKIVAAGVDVLQLREKHLSDAELLHRARRLASHCRAHNVLFIVNDRPDIAVLAGAAGVHAGQDDLPVADVRRVVPSSMLVGASTHTEEQVDRAIEMAPDYIAVGPMFPSITKPQDHVPGPNLLKRARGRTGLPLVAIGGIDQGRAREVLAAGPVCLCVCGAVLSAPDPAKAIAGLREAVAAVGR